jgi:hypothetical protein
MRNGKGGMTFLRQMAAGQHNLFFGVSPGTLFLFLFRLILIYLHVHEVHDVHREQGRLRGRGRGRGRAHPGTRPDTPVVTIEIAV